MISLNGGSRPTPAIQSRSLNGNYAVEMVIPLSFRCADDRRTAMERRDTMTPAQQLKRVFNIDVEKYHA